MLLSPATHLILNLDRFDIWLGALLTIVLLSDLIIFSRDVVILGDLRDLHCCLKNDSITR